jgi:YggT family protein
MGALIEVIVMASDIYIWIVIASAAVSWLIAFDVINVKNEQAANLVSLLNRLTEPVYKPIRKYIPPLGGVDVTPIVIIFLIIILRNIIIRLLLPHMY